MKISIIFFIKALIILFTFAALSLVWINKFYFAEAEEFITDADSVGFSLTSNSYTVHYEWNEMASSTVSATVEPNPCNTCVAYCTTFECRNSCYAMYCQ